MCQLMLMIVWMIRFMAEVGTLEKSTWEGRPFQLYEFLRTSGGNDYYWRFNSTEQNLVYFGDMFYAVPITDNGAKFSGEASSTELEVTLPVRSNFCDQYRLGGTVPSDTVWLRIRRAHVEQIETLEGQPPTITSDAMLTWIGTVNGITQTDDLSATVTCAMLPASFKRGGLRYGYQHTCPHILYMANTCKANPGDFQVTGAVTEVAGLTVKANEWATKPDGWFNGGFILYTLPSGMIERRMILNHHGMSLDIHGIPAGMAVGDLVIAYAGCDRTIATCQDKFNNLDNNGSFPHSPGRNPFDGKPLF
jgi:Phage conserved hypothetical protein BR0599